MNKKVIGTIIFGVLLVAGLFVFTMNNNSDNKPDQIIENNEVTETPKDAEPFVIDIGREAPDFTLETLDGKTVSLSDFRGKNVLINFWATWCPYCVKEMPDLNRLYVENKENDFVVLAVDVGEQKADVEKYINENPYEFPVLLDKDGRVSMEYLVRGIPTSYMIDKEGVIRAVKMNMMTYPEMKQMLEILGE